MPIDNWKAIAASNKIPLDLVGEYLWLQECYKKSQAEYRSRTTPFQRLTKLIKDNCKVARVDGWRSLENVWIWGDSVVFQLERASWDDVPGSGNWLAYLRRVFVVNERQGAGYGTRFVGLLRDWCEEAGAAVCFVSVPFGFARDSIDPREHCLRSVDEVVALWEVGECVERAEQEWLRGWYLQRGYRNANIRDDHFFSFVSQISGNDQFVYFPESLSRDAKLSAMHRLEVGGERSDESLGRD